MGAPFQENSGTENCSSRKKLMSCPVISLSRLPSLPNIQLKLFDACCRKDANPSDAADIIRQDPALCFKLLHRIQGSGPCTVNRSDMVESAVNQAGVDSILNMLALSSFDMISNNLSCPDKSPYLSNFWSHSLKCALICESVAKETGYKYPNEAFTAGILHDIGKLVLAVNFPGIERKLFRSGAGTIEELILDEETNLGVKHAEIAASLADQRGFYSILTDAIRYHHYPFERILTSSQLVRILFASNILSFKESAQLDSLREKAIKAAGISRDQAEKYTVEADNKILEKMDFFGIKNIAGDDSAANEGVQVWQSLLNRVNDYSMAGGMAGKLFAIDKIDDVLSLCRTGLVNITGLSKIFIFLYNKEHEALFPAIAGSDNLLNELEGFTLPLDFKESLPVSSFLKNKVFNSFESSGQAKLSLIDEQIIHMMQCEGLCCIPLTAGNTGLGTAVIGLDRLDLPGLQAMMPKIEMFTDNVSLALHAEREMESRALQYEKSFMESNTVMARKTVHEINNPLSVIKNYLNVLGAKLSGYDYGTQDELRIINEEINRIGKLLRALVSGEENPEKKGAVNVNSVIRDIVKLARGTLSTNSGIEVDLKLDDSVPDICCVRDNFKQVFINLLNNAIEVLPEGGKICISTEYLNGPIENEHKGDSRPGSGIIRVSVMDDGPGIPPDIREKLFMPVVSSKKGHEGLGLSVVKKLVDDMKGKIWVNNPDGGGTCFVVQLPAVKKGL